MARPIIIYIGSFMRTGLTSHATSEHYINRDIGPRNLPVGSLDEWKGVRKGPQPAFAESARMLSILEGC